MIYNHTGTRLSVASPCHCSPSTASSANSTPSGSSEYCAFDTSSRAGSYTATNCWTYRPFSPVGPHSKNCNEIFLDINLIFIFCLVTKQWWQTSLYLLRIFHRTIQAKRFSKISYVKKQFFYLTLSLTVNLNLSNTPFYTNKVVDYSFYFCLFTESLVLFI